MKLKKTKGEILLNKKKYPYTLTKKNSKTIFVECRAAKISQDFLVEDVANFLIDLPELIIAEKEYTKKASEIIQFRVTPKDKIKIEKIAHKKGYESVSSYIRENLLSL